MEPKCANKHRYGDIMPSVLSYDIVLKRAMFRLQMLVADMVAQLEDRVHQCDNICILFQIEIHTGLYQY